MARKRKNNRRSSNYHIRTKQEAELNALRRNLFASLSPKTALESVAAEMVVACSLHCKVAAVLDAKSATLVLVEQTPEAEGVTNSQAVSRVSQWHSASPKSRRDAIRFLEQCSKDFGENLRVRDEWKEDMDRGWGEDLFADLKKFEPANTDALLLATHLVKHARLYRKPLPDTPGGECKVIPDPLLQKQMVSKLLNQEIRHLMELTQITNQRTDVALGGTNRNALGLVSNQVTPAMFALQGAVEWFKRVRRHNL
jgi:hypothetical protein